MGTFINDIEVTGGLKIERVVTVPITVGYGDLGEIANLVEDVMPSSIEATVKRVTSSSETADVVFTQTGQGVDEDLILRALDETGIRYVVGRVKSRRADQAAGSDED